MAKQRSHLYEALYQCCAFGGVVLHPKLHRGPCQVPLQQRRPCQLLTDPCGVKEPQLHGRDEGHLADADAEMSGGEPEIKKPNPGSTGLQGNVGPICLESAEIGLPFL